MQVSIENVSTLERKITVGIPASQIDSAFDSKVNEVSKTVKLDGFRPGKVSTKVVRKRFGDALRAEVIEKAIQESLFEAMTKEDIKPAGMPTVESIKDEAGQDVEFVAAFEVFPDVELANFDKLDVEKRSAELKDADFDQRLTELQERAKEWVEADRAAKDGDQVIIDYDGQVDGEAFEGGAAQASPLELGSNSMIEGFEAGIVGAKAGEEKVLNLKFPDEYHAEELKGKDVVFTVKVNTVNESSLPALDDELAKKMGVEDGLDALKTQLRDSMDKELEQALKGDVKQQVMEQLIKLHDVAVPKAVITQQINVLKQRMMSQFGEMAGQMDMSIFPDEMFEEKATENGALSLILSTIIDKKSLVADRAAVKAYIENMAASYGDQADEVIQYYMADPQRTAEIEAVVLEEQLVELALTEANVTEIEVDFAEAIKPRETAEAEGE